MSARYLKIDTHSAGQWLKRKLFPGLRIRGQWLGKAGFEPGARVSVRVVGPGQLLIEQEESRARPNPGAGESAGACPGELQTAGRL